MATTLNSTPLDVFPEHSFNKEEEQGPERDSDWFQGMQVVFLLHHPAVLSVGGPAPPAVAPAMVPIPGLPGEETPGGPYVDRT